VSVLIAWERTPWWDRPEPPWEDDGCEALRVAAVSSVPGLHPRARRALEIALRVEAGPAYWREHTVADLAGRLRRRMAGRLERLRTERLEAEAAAAEQASRERERMRMRSGRWL
jgi:hypothetical protein